MPALRRHAGSSARTSSAPMGWNAPDPRPEAKASSTRSGKVVTKPISEKVSAVQTSVRPVNRVPNRSGSTPKRGCDTAAMPLYARLTSPAKKSRQPATPAAVPRTHQPDGGQRQLEPSDQDRIEDGKDAHIAVDREMAEHQCEQLAVPKKVLHQAGKGSAPRASIVIEMTQLSSLAVGELLYLSRADVERLLDVDAMLDALAKALVIFSSGITSVPPRAGARVGERGLLGTMPGYVPGVALEVKLVSVFPGNHHHGLPSHQGLIMVFDEPTGAPLALRDGTYITAIRTGGTAAVAARLLAREDASVLAILGAGVQGGSHLETFPRIRDFKEIRVASRDLDKAKELAARHSRAKAVDSFEAAVRGADVVACCTDAREPILRREGLAGRGT